MHGLHKRQLTGLAWVHQSYCTTIRPQRPPASLFPGPRHRMPLRLSQPRGALGFDMVYTSDWHGWLKRKKRQGNRSDVSRSFGGCLFLPVSGSWVQTRLADWNPWRAASTAACMRPPHHSISSTHPNAIPAAYLLSTKSPHHILRYGSVGSLRWSRLAAFLLNGSPNLASSRRWIPTYFTERRSCERSTETSMCAAFWKN